MHDAPLSFGLYITVKSKANLAKEKEENGPENDLIFRFHGQGYPGK